MRTFRSDNTAGLCPEALDAIVEANDGVHRNGYGDDVYTERAVDAFKAILGDDIAVFFVATGTAANTLAIAAMTEPWERVLCHEHSHWNADESTAPERITHCRTTPIVTGTDRLTVDDIRTAVAGVRGDVHEPQPGVLTISNVAELGAVYGPDELGAFCELAHEQGYRVHVDGARFANAVAALGCDPRAIAGDAGVDALSFGGTKNGLALGEAVVFFRQGDGAVFDRATSAIPYHRKGTGHLLSKHRFVAAPFAAMLETGAWLRHAAHANAMAKRLGDALSDVGLPPRFHVETSTVLVTMPEAVRAHLFSHGHSFYPFGDAEWNAMRLMCSFDTTSEDVDALVDDVRTVLATS